MHLFAYIKNIGKLWHIASLVRGNEEVLFICEDSNGKRYIVESYDSWNSVFVISEISDEEISNLLDNKISITEAFAGNTYITEMVNDKIVAKKQKIPQKLLPNKSVYLNASPNTVKYCRTELDPPIKVRAERYLERADDIYGNMPDEEFFGLMNDSGFCNIKGGN